MLVAPAAAPAVIPVEDQEAPLVKGVDHVGAATVPGKTTTGGEVGRQGRTVVILAWRCIMAGVGVSRLVAGIGRIDAFNIVTEANTLLNQYFLDLILIGASV